MLIEEELSEVLERASVFVEEIASVLVNGRLVLVEMKGFVLVKIDSVFVVGEESELFVVESKLVV